MSVNGNCLEGIVVSYRFHKFDIDYNDMYFFKIEDAQSLTNSTSSLGNIGGHN